MPSKRSHGEGTLRHRSDGRWELRMEPVEDEEGRVDPYLAVREANTKYAYTDVHQIGRAHV